MKPVIDSTEFGRITISKEPYDHDVVIRLNGEVKKRKKKLSKQAFGTSHKVSLDEANHIFEKGAEQIIIGTGQYGALGLSDEAKDFFSKKGCRVVMLPTPEAITAWNKAKGAVIAMFHITC
jgi:hypothetical protein